MFKIGKAGGKFNSWYPRNHFSTCQEEIVNIAHISSHKISLRETLGKYSLYVKVTSTLVAEQLAEIIYVLAENLRRFVTQNITTAYRVQIDKIQHNTIHALCFLLKLTFYVKDCLDAERRYLS